MSNAMRQWVALAVMLLLATATALTTLPYGWAHVAAAAITGFETTLAGASLVLINRAAK